PFTRRPHTPPRSSPPRRSSDLCSWASCLFRRWKSRALDQAQGDGTQFKVINDGTDASNAATTGGDISAGCWKFRNRAIKVQECQEARGTAKVFYARDGFLSAVAALFQVDCARNFPASNPVCNFVRNGLIVQVRCLFW